MSDASSVASNREDSPTREKSDDDEDGGTSHRSRSGSSRSARSGSGSDASGKEARDDDAASDASGSGSDKEEGKASEASNSGDDDAKSEGKAESRAGSDASGDADPEVQRSHRSTVSHRSRRSRGSGSNRSTGSPYLVPPGDLTQPSPKPRQPRKKPAPAPGTDLRQLLHPDLPQPVRPRAGPRKAASPTSSPGPVYYPNPNALKPSGPNAVMGKDQRFPAAGTVGPRANCGDSPGPVYYVEKKWRDKPISFSKDKRWTETSGMLWNSGHGPGPSDYNPDDRTVSTRRAAPAFRMPCTQRPMNLLPEGAIGVPPNDPSLEGSTTSLGPGRPRKKKRRETRILGGPLDSKAPCTFGTPHAVTLRPSMGPGPGAYHVESKLAAKGAKLGVSGRAAAGMVLNTSEVGPGSYSPNSNYLKSKSPSTIMYFTSD